MRSRISYKLIAALACITIPTITLFSFLVVRTHNRHMLDQLKLQIDQLSETVKSSTKQDMLVKHRARLHRTIKNIGQQEGIERIRIFNKEGEIIFSTNDGEVGSMVDKQAEACYACHAADRPLERLEIRNRARIFSAKDGVRRLAVINPIYNEPLCWQAPCHAHTEDQRVLGVLDFTMSLKRVDDRLRASSGQLVLFSVLIIAVSSVMLGLLVQRLIGRPVSELVRATGVIAGGDLGYRIPGGSTDELGNLAQSFNTMTEKLAGVQRQLYQHEKLASIGRLAAGIAHEINNPLTGILTYTSLCMKRAAPGSEDERELEVVVRETKRCRDIVRRLLDFSRQVPASRSLTDLNEVVGRALNILENQISLSQVIVHKDLQPELPRINGDGNQLQQVAVNLLVNALDAMEGRERRALTITTRREPGGAVQLIVADTGVGIAPDEQHKIFEPFYSTKGPKGTGLGLSVVWGIVEEHGGKISVISGPEKGSQFTIELPAAG